MVHIPGKNLDVELKRVKKNVEGFYRYFKKNYKRYNGMRRFVFVSTMSNDEEAVNRQIQRPSPKFPIVLPYIARLRGEFAAHEPAIKVSAQDGYQVDPQTIELVEGYLRHVFYEAKLNNFEYNIYTDTLTGGFSGALVYTEYTSDNTFNQDICVKRTFDPTMTFWDISANEDDKSDGMHCGEIYPMFKEEFEREYGKDKAQQMKFYGSELEGFNWSYRDQDQEEIILVCDYYEKKIKKETIVLLPDNQVMTKKEYNERIKFNEMMGSIVPPPVIVAERKRDIVKIVRYQFCETEILSYEETMHESLPIVFFDGDSHMIKDNNNSGAQQFTRPIVMDAVDAQRLKNLSGQALCMELENMQQSQFLISDGSIPPDQMEAWTNPQLPSNLIYKAYDDSKPALQLPPPMPVMRRPIPPEIMQTFNTCDMSIAASLGSFDQNIARLGEKEHSGIAIEKSLSLGNAAAMPYVVGFLKGLQSIGNKIVQLMPKVMSTPRTLPIRTADGKMQVVNINQDGSQSINFDRNALKVKIEAGPSFGAQKEKAYQALVGMMNVSPTFNQFMNSKGMTQLLDNIPDIRGIDQLKMQAEQFMVELQKMQAQAAQKPDPATMLVQVEGQKVQARAQIDQAKLQAEVKQDAVDNQLEVAKLMLEKQKLELETAKIQAQINIDLNQSQTDSLLKGAELAIKQADQQNKELLTRQKTLDSLIDREIELKKLKDESERTKEMIEK